MSTSLVVWLSLNLMVSAELLLLFSLSVSSAEPNMGVLVPFAVKTQGCSHSPGQ